MKKKAALAVIVACFVVGLISDASAFDGHRKGFILGLGLGPSLTPVDGDNKIVLVNTSFKIGVGLSEQFQLYWSSKGAWYKTDIYFEWPKSESVTELFGVAGLGMSYYLQPTKPSLYITSSIGYSALSLPFDTEHSIDPEMGLGLSMGIGYEFSAHYSIECNLANGSISSDSGWSYPRWSFQVTLNALAY